MTACARHTSAYDEIRSTPCPAAHRVAARRLGADAAAAPRPRYLQRARRDQHVTATGDTAAAAQAMAVRLTSAGYAAGDVRVFTPAPRKGNLVARLRGSGAKRPILLLAHIDVVEARREDWS